MREELLTASVNNRLMVGLGIPALVYVIVALSTSRLSAPAEFFWLVMIGAVY